MVSVLKLPTLAHGTLSHVRILVDYRPALRQRTGVGEYIHELIRAYAGAYDDDVVVFTSSWRDRPPAGLAAELGAGIVDRRVPVRALNLLWHRVEWPPIEALAGRVDVVHAAHPLLIPARHAAQVVTIHDLFFLSHPERTTGEIRRDYAALAAPHARRADAVVTTTEHGRRQIIERLGVDGDRVHVCPPGAPSWTTSGRAGPLPPDGHVLFVGTLEPRKNLGVLLDAWEQLLARGAPVTRLILAGRATTDAQDWLDRIARPPLAGHVRHTGYVEGREREELYATARAVVLPSLDEGFGLPALEAMSAGVPIIASNRGSLPEVVGHAGVLIEPDDAAGLADAIERVFTDETWAEERRGAGLARARAFTWPRAAASLRHAYSEAMAVHRSRRASPMRSQRG